MTYISVKKYAEKWGISEDTVRRHIKAGRLEAYKIGRVVRIPEEAIIAELLPYQPTTEADFKGKMGGLL